MFIGVDIGGTHTRVATGEKSKIFEKVEFPTEDFEKTINLICNSIKKITNNKVSTIGVSVAGPYNFSKKTLLLPPNLPDQDSWENKNIAKEISNNIGVQTVAAHDASVIALAIATYGVGKGKNPVLYYTVSTGIGSGLVVDGKIYHGINNPEPGHQILSKSGESLESLASGSALKRKYNKEPKDIEGSPEWEEAMEFIAIGISNSILHFSPEIVVIGGGMTKHGEVFFTPLKKYLKKYVTIIPLPIVVPSTLGQDNGLIGALELARTVNQYG